MKKITNKEYEEYQRYKKDRLYGRVFTADSMRIICESCNNDPMSIGQYILENVRYINRKNQSAIGTIILRYSEVPPDNWLICDGQKVKADEYPKLLDLYESSSDYNFLITRDEKSGKIVSLEIPNFDGGFLIKVK